MKIEKCPFCGKDGAEISNCQELEECRHFEKCHATGPYVCVVCNIHEGGCGASSGYYVSEAKAIAAWNSRAQPSEKPLTLDELRQMAGEPVWVMHQDGSGARWGIVQDTEYGLCAVVDDDTAYWFTDVCGTIAYRSKPKEEHHEDD